MRSSGPLKSITAADGSGMIDLRHRLAENGTISGRTLATGNLSISEEIDVDQGDNP